MAEKQHQEAVRSCDSATKLGRNTLIKSKRAVAALGDVEPGESAFWPVECSAPMPAGKNMPFRKFLGQAEFDTWPPPRPHLGKMQ